MTTQICRRPSVVGSSASPSDSELDVDLELEWPFGRMESLRGSDLRETAYELFFMSCRLSPGFGTRGSLGGGEGSLPATVGWGPKGGTGMMVVNSRIKKALGLKARRSSLPMRLMNQNSRVNPGATGGGGPNSPGKVKRPMTSAEIMRQQMRVTEQSDNRLRKTLMRTLVGQVGRRAETIILPLELLRHLKPSEFSNIHEYHRWQRRQFRILEAGLLVHPFAPLERLNSAALHLREIIHASEMKPIDTSKNSDAMRALSTSVATLACCSTNPSSSDACQCHWADGFPLNAHLYLALLHSIFDLKEETVVLDEVDELIELMKKTWSTLGLNRMIHNVCLTWVLFYQYVATGQTEPDLIGAALAMLAEVGKDAKRPDREASYFKVLSGILTSMQRWAETKLMDYHENFEYGMMGDMDTVLNLALSTASIIARDVPSVGAGLGLVDRDGGEVGNRVEYYIRSAVRNAFTKKLENGRGADSMIVEVEEDGSELLAQLARDTEKLALAERVTFGPVLKRWHPVPGAVAVATLHNCFGVVLKEYMARVEGMTNEVIRVLQSAGKLEKVLVQMVVEDTAECDDGGKGVVREMIPYEVDSIIVSLMKAWIEERLRIGRECLNRAKETESWVPMSKTEPYSQFAMDLMKLAKVTVDEFFDIPVAARDDMVHDLADGLETLFQDYTAFVASCGSKHGYIPTLPPLTRCNQDTTLVKLWKKAAAPCKAGAEEPDPKGGDDATDDHQQHPRPSTSRGTHRLYIRLNTLHYLHSHIHALGKSLSFFSHGHHHRGPSPAARVIANTNRRLAPSHHFDLARSSIQSAIQTVSEVAAYRLVFLDSHNSFIDALYVGDVASARIPPALRVLKQNLGLLVSVLADRAQPVAVKDVMRAAYEAFMMVLLAGGSERAFVQSDYEMVVEDLWSLKRLFCTCGEGLVAEEVVEREAEVVEGVVGLMGQPTEQLVEDFSVMACESNGFSVGSSRVLGVALPPTTGRWNRADPNTVLRVLCHRNDDVADQFLRKTFQLPKRR